MSAGTYVDSHDARCKRAATAQGLDQAAARLNAAGVTYGIEQTGGYCMVLTVRVPAGTYGVTFDGTGDPRTDDAWTTCYFPGTGWTDGDLEESLHVGDLAATVALLRAAADR